MTFKAPDSLAEQIARYLAERIIRGELKERERIQEQKVTQALNVSRGSVREALLILERRHLIAILPRRGAQVSELTAHHVTSLYALSIELYAMLARAVIEHWQVETDLAPFIDIKNRLQDSLERGDIGAFVENSFDVMRAAFPFADNPYLQETLENLLPAISRTYHLALERRKGEMGQFMNTFASLLQAIIARDPVRAREVLQAYGEHNCQLVLATLAER
ncbi:MULTISPECIES: GntR family transcriptional regulator [Ectopseudomonas]|jgi:DNA-binding GntR family transcriptional regulator|uniref:GntR family transcriptional regulator n=2 Tax=Ectopseudomonas mendocina TaxID=300 RepID=A0A379IX03_ECTME|nr:MULTISPECIES: GntR family transcriptional regulator [Pseudomonas]AEB57960.1 GntR family transcriptional regulator [Pseudomonas mendocina NK-01]ALN18942.1 GntR family transcriptional regulator [Pseudomonas mendocina S5.2]KES00196.1 GntR family transcriptional regulator [Pseudomonas mendocina]QTN45188.1 GntR family transcriptional regulator [Pseudomonas mendocina]TRO36147.1 GntR family transcriptional regulator [Pseudomonas sp. ALS1131]